MAYIEDGLLCCGIKELVLDHAQVNDCLKVVLGERTTYLVFSDVNPEEDNENGLRNEYQDDLAWERTRDDGPLPGHYDTFQTWMEHHGYKETDMFWTGPALAKVIRDNKLGALRTMKPRVNPNSSNKLQVWLWAPDKESIRKYLKGV